MSSGLSGLVCPQEQVREGSGVEAEAGVVCDRLDLLELGLLVAGSAAGERLTLGFVFLGVAAIESGPEAGTEERGRPRERLTERERLFIVAKLEY